MSKQFLDYTGLTKFKELSDDHYDEIKNVTWQEYEAIEDKNDDKAYFITDVPPSEQKKTAVKPLPTGAISTVNDAAELPLNALKVSVEAWQEGSGDPSPSNIRPIHGWSGCEFVIANDNLIPTGTDTNKGYVADGFLLNNGSEINSEDTYISEYFPIKPNITLYVSQKTASMNIAAVCFYDKNKIYISGNAFSRRTNFEVSVPSNAFYCRCTQPKDITQLAQITLKDTDIVAHQGTTTSQQFPTTIYGAEWDVVDGELKQTDGYIASYNGETLPSTWISDRDVYASGTTPTTGAEVVYKLATPTTIDLSPLSIRMLEGTNNVYADCGEVIEGEYFGNNTNQIRVNDEIIAGGNSVTFAAESKYAEHAEVADNACTFSVDENGLLTISLVSGDSNNSLSSTRSVKSTATLPPEEEITNEKSEEEEVKDESAEELVEEESEIVEEKTDETEEELSKNETEEEPSVEEEKDNDDGGEETPPEENMR